MTVFPFRESERNDPEKLLAAYQRVDNPTLLFRFRPEDAQHVIKRQGQASFNFGDYYAFSKICTHLGCPASLYEEQTSRILCPCHQSQFDALEYCKPVFGPAARPLPQLPLAVDEETGYFYARPRLHRACRTGLLGAWGMSSITTPTKPTNAALRHSPDKALNDVDERYHPAAGMRRQLNKVFPTHWSFLLGEIALYSFIVLLLSGVYLSLFFDPSMRKSVQRSVQRPARHLHVQGVRVHPGHLVRGSRRPVRPPAAPLGGAAVRGGDGRAHDPHLLHRRVPQAA